jgi:NAD(P)-dependent dehydrogenase (short-subunit alcohol dehydrogenase family)
VNTKRALVTGASSDIGLAICRAYASRGYRVLAHYRTDRDALSAFLKQHRDSSALKIDFADTGALERAIGEHATELRECCVLVHAAALLEPVPFEKLEAAALLRAYAANTVPAVLLTRVMAPAMAERKWGRIVHLTSIGTKFGGGASTLAYSLSKHALELLPAAGRRWAGANVLVNALRVGVTDTRMHKREAGKDMAKRVAQIPAGRMASAEEIARAVYWLGSEENGFVTGETISAAGGE